MTFNWKQTLTALKAGLASGGPSIIAVMQMFGYQASDVEKVVALVTTVVGIVLLVIDKSDTALVKDAASVPGTCVHVDTAVAPPAVVKAALDRDVKDVVPMVRPDPMNEGRLG